MAGVEFVKIRIKPGNLAWDEELSSNRYKTQDEGSSAIERLGQ